MRIFIQSLKYVLTFLRHTQSGVIIAIRDIPLPSIK